MAEQNNQKGGQAKEQDLNQLLKVRREKLAELQHAPGVTPYMGSDYRVHYRRADGARVPEWHEIAALVHAGHDHDITPDNALKLLAAL